MGTGRVSLTTNDAPSVANSAPWRRRDLAYFLGSLLIGLAGAIVRDLSQSGLSEGYEAPVALCVPLWMIVLAGIGIFNWRIFRTILWPLGALVIVLLTWTVTSAALPDAGRVYFQLRRSYIEANWKTDPQTGTIYFPIRYATFDGWSTEVPQYSFVFDKYELLRYIPFSNQLSVPSCPFAGYYARKMEDHVYLVSLFTDVPIGDVHPCLVTPTRTESSNQY
jgi:hypothetical protein